MTKLLSDFAKEYKGVHLRGDSISIDFQFKGVRCRETLINVRATKDNIKFAANKRTTILHEIVMQTFSYRKHFPNSKRASQFEPALVVPTVEESLLLWLEGKKSEVSKKTHDLMEKRVHKHIIPKFGPRKIDTLLQSEIKRWRMVDLGELANKTINDIMTPLRGIFADALADRVIEFNPCAHVPNLDKDSEDNADPFTMKELEAIENTDTHMLSERNAFMFAAWTGMRISEWMALAWEDVDFTQRTVKVQRSVVSHDLKVPKTKSSIRTIHLLGQAYDILVAQKALTFMLSPIRSEVGQSDKRRTKSQRLSYVFRQTGSNEPYALSAKYNYDFFTNHLKKAQVRDRGANQARHTFASQLLTKGVNERWIMREMGHTSITMFEKHYGRWIDEEMPDMADQVTKMFQNVTIASQRNTGNT
ncbi:tyrosine-type recombinase/integrase [Alteromonas sp. BMJM2]|uniref:tyrosine-type recombinase/integrase n=1 Tax=Alteromonas sp. BMJM2 TaxID=2954241 RepID=UPI0022B56413|nr:DUF3596 domain-containing protein [Alteromonas sp. BMJM2]